VANGKSDEGFKKRRREEIVKPDPSPNNLLDLVFVVQFHDRADAGSGCFTGRAEHLMSGRSKGFETPEELVDFFGRLMNRLNRDHKKHRAKNTAVQRSKAERGCRAGASARRF